VSRKTSNSPVARATAAFNADAFTLRCFEDQRVHPRRERKILGRPILDPSGSDNDSEFAPLVIHSFEVRQLQWYHSSFRAAITIDNVGNRGARTVRPTVANGHTMREVTARSKVCVRQSGAKLPCRRASSPSPLPSTSLAPLFVDPNHEILQLSSINPLRAPSGREPTSPHGLRRPLHLHDTAASPGRYRSKQIRRESGNPHPRRSARYHHDARVALWRPEKRLALNVVANRFSMIVGMVNSILSDARGRATPGPTAYGVPGSSPCRIRRLL